MAFFQFPNEKATSDDAGCGVSRLITTDTSVLAAAANKTRPKIRNSHHHANRITRQDQTDNTVLVCLMKKQLELLSLQLTHSLLSR